MTDFEKLKNLLDKVKAHYEIGKAACDNTDFIFIPVGNELVTFYFDRNGNYSDFDVCD